MGLEQCEVALVDAKPFLYDAFVQSVYDGDTIRADIDLGMHMSLRDEPLRLYGINAPEVRGESKTEGHKSRDYLRGRVLGSQIRIQTFRDKKGKFGRLLAIIWLKGETGWGNINAELVEKGYAVYKDY